VTYPAAPEAQVGEGDDEKAGRERVIRSHWEASQVEVGGAWQQKRRLAAAMRLVIERLVASDAPEEELRSAARELERYAEHLRTHPRLRHFQGYAESANAGDVGAFFDQSPLIGLANPLAPPVRLAKTGDRTALGRVRFGSAYEGPPGCVHGGFVAAAFDEVLGFTQSLMGNPGFTGTLSVRYRVPTPLHTELRFEGRIDGVERRKTFASGRVLAGETLCAEAEAIFVAARPERFQRLLEERARWEAAQRDPGEGG
jgi:acyl-coenzyme A thioesterase PaaI-like protein